MRQHSFDGTGVAIITPFQPDGAIDYPALGKLIEHLIQGGIDFIVSLGTTGEAITLSAEECRAIFDYTLEKVNGRIPVVAGLFGGNYTEKLVRGLQQYNFDGFSAIMSSSPAYSKPSQEGIYQHYMALAEVTPLPLIIYNVPGRTASNVEALTTLRLARASEQFTAVKEASGDIVQAMKILKNKPEGFQVWSGDDPITMPMLAAGATGAISVIANAFPAAFSNMVRAAMQGDLATAIKYNDQLLDIHPWLYVDGNPAGIKATLNIMGLCNNVLRIPQTPVSERTYEQLEKEVRRAVSVGSGQ